MELVISGISIFQVKVSLFFIEKQATLCDCDKKIF